MWYMRFLDYVHKIIDVEMQSKQAKQNRLQIETLWDTFENQPVSEAPEPVPDRKWELVMKEETNYPQRKASAGCGNVEQTLKK